MKTLYEFTEFQTICMVDSRVLERSKHEYQLREHRRSFRDFAGWESGIS